MTPVVFDLDGTLLDSAPDIRAAVNSLMAELDLPQFDLATIISFIGNGIGVLTARVARYHGLPEAEVPALTERLLHHYNTDPITLTKPYPGVFAALELLRAAGHPMAVCTNKPEAPARKVLSAFGFDAYIDVVVGGDTCPQRKPDPEPLRAALARLGSRTCIYVGDSEVDAETARNAAMPFLFFTGGYCHVPHDQLECAGRFSNWSDLCALVQAHSPNAP